MADVMMIMSQSSAVVAAGPLRRRSASLMPRRKCRPSSSARFRLSPSPSFPRLRSVAGGFVPVREVAVRARRRIESLPAPVMMGLSFRKASKWWETGLQSNMKKVQSTQDLVDSLVNAGNKLLVVHFFSPGCGGCKALHPKICQIAEMNPDVLFLHVNYEEHKSMAYSLNVHVLPFFRFYRGANGRLCSFSCTNATIKKFKDALAKHNTESCSLGPAKGLEVSELLALSANKDLSFTFAAPPVSFVEPALSSLLLPLAPATTRATQGSGSEALVPSRI